MQVKSQLNTSYSCLSIAVQDARDGQNALKCVLAFAPKTNMNTSKTAEGIMHANQRFRHQLRRVAFIVASCPPLVPSSQSDRSQWKVIPPSFVALARSDPGG